MSADDVVEFSRSAAIQSAMAASPCFRSRDDASQRLIRVMHPGTAQAVAGASDALKCPKDLEKRPRDVTWV
jgi:hypothetical protein